MLVWKPYEMIVNLITFFIWLCNVMNKRGIDCKGILVLSKDVYFNCRARSLEICNLVLMHHSDTERGFQPGYQNLKFFNDTELGLLVL
jgi:hypothetical protein